MPDGRKGECGGSISPRANIVKLMKTVEDYYRIYPENPAPGYGKTYFHHFLKILNQNFKSFINTQPFSWWILCDKCRNVGSAILGISN